MNSLARIPVLAALVALISGCASGQKRQERAAARLESAADEFKVSKHRYPRSVAELQTFLASGKTSGTLDLEPFAEVAVLASKDDSLSMFYKWKGVPPDELGVLVSTSTVSSHCGSLGQSQHRPDK